MYPPTVAGSKGCDTQNHFHGVWPRFENSVALAEKSEDRWDRGISCFAKEGEKWASGNRFALTLRPTAERGRGGHECPAPHKQGYTKPSQSSHKKASARPCGLRRLDLPAVGRDLLGGRGVGGVEGVGEGLRVGRAYSGYVVPAHFGVQGGRFVAGRAVKEEAG